MPLTFHVHPVQPADVLAFWFGQATSGRWFAADAAFDGLIRSRFADTLAAARRCELQPWRADAFGRLAEIIVLDQFARNLHRGTPDAWAGDALALALAQEAVAGGALAALDEDQRAFLLMPYMHSESAVVHGQAERLFREHASARSFDYELRHKAIIDRFGRYPHRNAILGRPSSAAELAFLQQPGSSF